MTTTIRPWIGRIARSLLVLGLLLTPSVSQPAWAQGPNDPAAAPEGEGQGQGRPLDGYIGTAILLALALFVVGKSARR
jgi:hypothetical protein